MSKALQGYHESRRRAAFPLTVLRAHVARHGPPDAAAIRALSAEIGLPAAAIRGALSFYADLHEPADAVRVCAGTSCQLARAGSVAEVLQKRGACRKAYCLGYCDQSPTVLHPDGRVEVRCSPDGSAERLGFAPERTDIRAACATPIVTRRIARGNFSEYQAAREGGVYRGLERALLMAPAAVIDALEQSGERGRGGAAYPTALKWRTCAQTAADAKYVVANGDEGDPGSFIDRILLEQDPHAILEGMAICAYAVGASEGIVFIRSEYPEALTRMERAIADATVAGMLGHHVCGSAFSFRVRAFAALGSYVCGEETAMLNAIEGFRGEVRLRPPFPAQSGLYGKPTVVDNVETLVNVGWIFEQDADAYRALGTETSSGTKAFCLNHGFARPGIVEVEFGMPLRTVIEDFGGGAKPGTELEAVILGGPMGSIVFPEAWDVPVCYDAMEARGIQLGHAGLVALPKGVDWERLLLHWLEFMSDESCGKCVPCRLGSKQALAIAPGASKADTRATLTALFEVMEEGSLCAFGKLLPGPMRTMMGRIAKHG